MAEHKSDTIRIRHMLDASQKAIQFTKSKNRSDLDTDEQLSLALVRLVEIIGEAASKVTDQTKERNPEIPWKNIIGTRNRIIHAYENVDYDILWQIVYKDLPELVKQLQNLLINMLNSDQQNFFLI